MSFGDRIGEVEDFKVSFELVGILFVSWVRKES
jgi:hypothetical protein